MTKRRITTVEEADAAMETLGFLKGHGSPNKDVRDLWECAVVYRSAIRHERAKNGSASSDWQNRVKSNKS